MRRLIGPLALLAIAIANPSSARTVHVHLDTSAWLYHQGYLTFTYVTSIPDSIILDEANRVCIRNLKCDGQMGQDDPVGGVGGGKDNALAMQPYTWTIDPDAVPELLGGKGRYPYNEVSVNFAKRYGLDPDEVWLGTFIDFDLELPDGAFVPKTAAPDALTMTFLNRNRETAFRTSDPLGGDALLVCAPKPGVKTWQVEAYEPAAFSPGLGRRSDLVEIVLPAPPVSAGSRVEQIHIAPAIRRVAREGGVVWIEYSIPVAVSGVRLRILDSSGTECFRHEIGVLSPGIYGDEWPKRGGTPPPPGTYRVILEAGGRLVDKRVEL